jgi:uncharacterized repeat protein (TIGR01451 family)
LPKIYGFSPDIGPPGAVVTITGTSLFDVTSVEFNGASAPVSSATTNQAKVAVPANATTGPLTVVTPYGNDTSTNSFTVTHPSTVMLTKTASPDVAGPGTNVTYLLLVTNKGPSIVSSTVVTDTMPAGLTFISAAASVGTWVYTNGLVIWDIGLLADSNTVNLQIVGTSTTAAVLTNNAVLSFAEGNLAPYDNYASIESFFVTDSQRTLSIARQAYPPGVVLSWPLSPVNFLLQINTGSNLDTNWTYPTNVAFVTNSLNIFTDTFAAPQTFFRLAPP